MRTLCYPLLIRAASLLSVRPRDYYFYSNNLEASLAKLDLHNHDITLNITFGNSQPRYELRRKIQWAQQQKKK